MKEYNTLDDFDVENKTVLLRVDFNMPLDQNTLDILDATRIERALPTIRELTKKNAKTVILAHQGRQGSWDFISLDRHARVLEELLEKDVEYVDDIYGEEAKSILDEALKVTNQELNVYKIAEENGKIDEIDYIIDLAMKEMNPVIPEIQVVVQGFLIE